MDRAVTKTAPVAALLTAMLVAAACGGATSTPTASSSAKPVAGGALTYLHTMEATSLDPVDATGSSSLGGNAQQFYAVYGGLDYYGRAGRWRPGLIESPRSRRKKCNTTS